MRRMSNRDVLESRPSHQFRRRSFRQRVRDALRDLDLPEDQTMATFRVGLMGFGLGGLTTTTLAVWAPAALLATIGLIGLGCLVELVRLSIAVVLHRDLDLP